MSLRPADVCFLLADPVRTFTADIRSPVAAALTQAGAERRPAEADVAVVHAPDAAAALRTTPRAVITYGRGGRRALGTALPVVRRFIALPDSERPHLLLPADRHSVSRYALRTWMVARGPVRRARNAVAERAIGRGWIPDLPQTVTVAAQDTRPPFVLRAAAHLGLPPDPDYFLTLGLGDDLTRAVFHVFAAGERRPCRIVKFSRVPGLSEPFAADERALSVASQSAIAAEHAPTFHGRFRVAGLEGSVETAAVGERLTYALQRPGPRAAKQAWIDAVAAWLVALGRDTATPPSALSGERNRIAREVLSQWPQTDAPALLKALDGIPGVMQHNDVGCWNIIVGAGSFYAVDWESARTAGLPLWDLAYFLVDACVHLDGAWASDRRERYAAELLTGRARSSGLLFSWLTRAAASLSIPSTAIAPLVTLGWLHHGLSPAQRSDRATALSTVPAAASPTFAEWMVRVWMTTPGLGTHWEAFAAGQGAS